MQLLDATGLFLWCAISSSLTSRFSFSNSNSKSLLVLEALPLLFRPISCALLATAVGVTHRTLLALIVASAADPPPPPPADDDEIHA